MVKFGFPVVTFLGAMKIQTVSDLHLEFAPLDLPIAPGVETLILAGDIHCNLDYLFEWLSEIPEDVDIIFVPGNHEYYGGSFKEQLAGIQEMQGFLSNLHVLAPGIFKKSGVQIIGATLWTDFNLYGDAPIQMVRAFSHVNDFKWIQLEEGLPFLPSDVLRLHQTDLEWIEESFERENSRTLVVSHHGPSPQSIVPKYQGQEANVCYVSNLEPLIHSYQPRYWFHGHIHDSVEYNIGQTTVFTNPRGYGPDYLNQKFNPNLVIDL